MPVGILERELGRLFARLLGVKRLAGGNQFPRGAMHEFEHFGAWFARKFSAFKVGLEGIETVLKGHGKSPLVAKNTSSLPYPQILGYSRSMDNIYPIGK